jgi:hypothetical protein
MAAVPSTKASPERCRLSAPSEQVSGLLGTLREISGLTSGNLAVANHVKDGRALRLFQGTKGIVQYIGEFVLDDQDPYDWGTAHSTRGGPQRRVIRFHLRRVDRPPPRPETGPLGVPFQPRNETMKPTSPPPGRRGIRTPPAVGGVPTTSCRTNSPNSSARLGGRRGIRRRSTGVRHGMGNSPRHRGGRGQELHEGE